MTCATWMRNFVRNHADYRGDSVVSEIAFDLLQECKAISNGTNL